MFRKVIASYFAIYSWKLLILIGKINRSLVSIDVCKLALDYLSNGVNTKKVQAAAGKPYHSLEFFFSYFNIFRFSKTKHNNGYPGRRHKSLNYASNQLRQK